MLTLTTRPSAVRADDGDEIHGSVPATAVPRRSDDHPDIPMPAKFLKRPGGSLDVWIDGWHLEFDGDSRPTWERGDPPDDAADEAPGVRVDESGSPKQVRVGGWVVALDAEPTATKGEPTAKGEPRATRVKPDPDHHRMYKKAPGGGA